MEKKENLIKGMVLNAMQGTIDLLERDKASLHAKKEMTDYDIGFASALTYAIGLIKSDKRLLENAELTSVFDIAQIVMTLPNFETMQPVEIVTAISNIRVNE